MTEAPFVETSVSRDIFNTINNARAFKKCAAIIGRPGVGKTRSLEAYSTEDTSARLMTVTGVTGNALRDLLLELCELLGIYASGSIASIQRRMFNYDLSHHVLIIDEAQNLKLQAYREVLHLYDFTGMVIVFCGNDQVLRRVNTDKGAFAQISRRVPIHIELDAMLDEDADKISSAFGVEGMDAFRLMRAIGAAYETDGVVSVLQFARRLAGTRTIRAADIRAACEPIPRFRLALSRHAAS